MDDDYLSRKGYLTFTESIGLTLSPALFFLINGISVLVLKSFEAPISAYFLFLALTFAFFGCWCVIVARQNAGRAWLLNKFKKFAPILLAPLVFALAHFYFYGSSYGGDTASYFTNPIHTFFGSGHFSHSEDPFFEFGEQPLAVYWLMANSEFFFTGLGYILGLDYPQILALMHICSNYLLGLSICAIALRFMSLNHALFFSACLLFMLYGLLDHRRDFSASSVFRGFENKGLIWGYFFWSCINLFGPIRENMTSASRANYIFLFLAGAILGSGSYLVSGNAVNLLLPAIVLTLGAMLSGQYKTLYAFLGFALTLCLGIAIFTMLEVSSIYEVVTLTPAYEELYIFENQKPFSQYPLWCWGLCAAIIAALAISELKWGLYLGLFLLVALVIRSEVYFDFFLQIAPEFMLVFWRHVTLLNPLVILLLGGCLWLSRGPLAQKLWKGLLGIALSVLFLFSIGALTLPTQSPFGQADSRPTLEALAKLCPAKSRILSPVPISTHLPTLQPNYVYIVGKEPFINWQIGNLSPSDPMREFAANARYAALYLQDGSASVNESEALAGLEFTIEHLDPDAIFMRSLSVNRDNESLFKGYDKQEYRGVTAFTKPHCQSNFPALAEKIQERIR